jgi:hypothetical protein
MMRASKSRVKIRAAPDSIMTVTAALADIANPD